MRVLLAESGQDAASYSHGGILGIMTACLLFARRHTITPLHLFDLCTLTGTIGVFFGRIANFINSELLGRPCDPTLPWAVEFPKEITEWPAREPERLGDLAPIIGELGTSEVGVTVAEWQAAAGGFAGGDPTREQIDIVTQVTERIVHVVNSDRAAGDTVAHMLDPLLTARHPSQIYAALLEGLALFIVLAWLWRKPRKPGIVTGAFLVGYAIVRIINEQWRMPDAHIGFQALGLTRGQWLSVAMLAVGVTCMIIWSRYDIPRLGGWMTGPASEAVPNTELNDQDKEAP